MRRRNHSQRGLTLIEVAIAMIIAVIIMAGSTILIAASNDLAQSATRQQVAQTRADRVLRPVAQHLRKGSLSSAQKPDGTTFSDGETATGVSIAQVIGWDGAPVIGDRVAYLWIVPAGEDRGVIEARSPAGRRVVARDVTDFRVTRDGTRFALRVQTAVGPDNDRARTHDGLVAVAPRSP